MQKIKLSILSSIFHLFAIPYKNKKPKARIGDQTAKAIDILPVCPKAKDKSLK